MPPHIPAKKQTLGLTMIVRDEEEVLARCLGSLKGIFDQIVIADTGSVDRTVEISKSFGAEVHHFEWIDDFGAARNFSLSKVTTDWWMWMDADDILTDENHRRLVELKASLEGAEDIDAFLMEYDYAQGELGDSICRFPRHRVIRNDKKHGWRLPIHEHITISQETRVAMSNVVITHKRTAKAFQKDSGRNIRILRRAFAMSPNDERLHFYFGKELWSEGLYDEAIQVLGEHQIKGGWHENLVNGAFYLALCNKAKGDSEKAINSCLIGIRRDPRFAEFFTTIGQVYYEQSKWTTAARFFEIAASLPIPKTLASVFPGHYTWIPMDFLCKCYSELGNFGRAWECNEVALRHRPGDKRFLYSKAYLEDILFDRLEKRLVRLNLDSGGIPCAGYRSCDKNTGIGVDLAFGGAQLPYHTGTVHSIRSERPLDLSLEKSTLLEWARALRHGGRLHLVVPGTEAFENGHLSRLLDESGFDILGVSKRGGFGGTSIEIEAVQLKANARILWMLPSADCAHPATRIRRLNVSGYLGRLGMTSSVFEGADGRTYAETDETDVVAIARQSDVVVFTVFTARERRIMDSLRACGVSVVADYCEDLADTNHEVAECLRSSTLIVCCSTALARKVSHLGRTEVIEDAYELPVGGVFVVDQ